MQRLASDGGHASRLVLLTSLVVGVLLGSILPRDIPGAFFDLIQSPEGIRKHFFSIQRFRSDGRGRERGWARRLNVEFLHVSLSTLVVVVLCCFFSPSTFFSQPSPHPFQTPTLIPTTSGPWGRASAILGWASTGCWFVGKFSLS